MPFYNICTNLHGITADDVINAPKFHEVFVKIYKYMQHYPVVAHNARFDISVLEKSVWRNDLQMPVVKCYDTLTLYKGNL